MGLVENGTCDYCEFIDTIEHRFITCEASEIFWKCLKEWWEECYDEEIFISEKLIIFGSYTHPNYTLDNILLTAKYFIHVQKCNQQAIHFRHFKAFLKGRIDIERNMLQKQKKLELFRNRWEQLKFV